jgi:anti-sigma B factor antagonist
MEIAERTIGEVKVLDLSGRITVATGNPRLKGAVETMIQQGHIKILVNLAGVTYLDSAGLGELLISFNLARRAGGSLKLVNATTRISDLLAAAKLQGILENYSSEESAIGSFS